MTITAGAYRNKKQPEAFVKLFENTCTHKLTLFTHRRESIVEFRKTILFNLLCLKMDSRLRGKYGILDE